MLLAALLVSVLVGRPVAAQGEHQASWWDRTPDLRSAYYRIKSDLPTAEKRAYARHLDRMYEEYSRRLASLPARAPEKLDVFIFARHDEYLQTLKARWDIDGKGTGGMFFVTSRGSGLAFWTESLPVRRVHHVIQHEGFHQFAFSRFGHDLPIWVNEGLAEFFGESVLVNDRVVLGQSTPRVIVEVQKAIEVNEHIPFRNMLSMDGSAWNQSVKAGNAGLQYMQAWSMVHFLVYGDDTAYQRLFEDYLRLLNQGIASEAAFVRVFGPDIEAFERRWLGYAAEAKPSSFVTALERIEFLAEGALALSREGRSPESLDALREQLEAIEFVHVIGTHGRAVELLADDAENYAIPADDLSKRAPSFSVKPVKRKRVTRRDERYEEIQPTPPDIRTSQLRPYELIVEWQRDRDTGAVHYKIVVR